MLYKIIRSYRCSAFRYMLWIHLEIYPKEIVFIILFMNYLYVYNQFWSNPSPFLITLCKFTKIWVAFQGLHPWIKLIKLNSFRKLVKTYLNTCFILPFWELKSSLISYNWVMIYIIFSTIPKKHCLYFTF